MVATIWVVSTIAIVARIASMTIVVIGMFIHVCSIVVPVVIVPVQNYKR